jgi:hypothetical protein
VETTASVGTNGKPFTLQMIACDFLWGWATPNNEAKSLPTLVPRAKDLFPVFDEPYAAELGVGRDSVEHPINPNNFGRQSLKLFSPPSML